MTKKKTKPQPQTMFADKAVDPIDEEVLEIATSVADAKRWLRDNYDKPQGCLCPACGQNVRLATRSISPSQVRALAAIAAFSKHADAHAWVDVAKFEGMRGGDYAKLRFWGLIESRTESTGVWRVTHLGRKFLSGKHLVPKNVFVYNNRVRAVSEEVIGVRDIIGGNETLPDSLLANGTAQG